ncbi:oligosaccharyltransferase complex subunit (non-catalytic) [Columba livia]|uniref:Oligosaccharyltransferase complex subunit n=1 Tax=Columba livia TaxID=8932 RepID=A0A2I0M961_COLLI|nr:oligosaccharyltransferase complex subunit (non-catalytic) [Columba livia]
MVCVPPGPPLALRSLTSSPPDLGVGVSSGGGPGWGPRAPGSRPPTCKHRVAACAGSALYRLPFAVLECPNIKLKRPSWVHMPSAMTVYALVVVSYFLITGGIIYDVIVEPPSVGSMTDEHGHQRPVAFLAYRVNGQYIMEGLASSFLFTMGGLGFIILDRSNAPNIPKLNRFLLLFIGFVSVLLSFFMARVFMRMKLPGYLMG